MPSTTSLGAPYPVPGDDPNVPGDMQALASWLNTYLLGPAWITLPLAAGVQAGATAGTSSGSYTPAYRVWGSGRVEYRGSIERTSGTAFNSSALLFNIPVAAMPASIVRAPFTGSVSSSINENGRLELTPTDGQCLLYAATGDYLFVSLDALFYYKN